MEIDQKSVWDRLGRVLAAAAPGALGIEAHALTVRDAERVSGLTRGRVVPTTDLVERLRAIKSPEEVAAIRAAADLAQAALAEVLPTVRPGQTELEIAAALEAALRRRGSEWHPFPTIVASGPAVGAAPRAHQPAARAGRASGCCSTSARRWTDTAPTSPARWWSGRARTSASGRSTSWSGPRSAGRSSTSGPA